MIIDSNKNLIFKKLQLVTIDVFYFRPDYKSLIQEFIWQTDDIVPELHRTHKFLNHWHKNIDAVIQEITISINERRYGSYRSVDAFLNLH
jgi:uncharacterized protein Usg